MGIDTCIDMRIDMFIQMRTSTVGLKRVVNKKEASQNQLGRSSLQKNATCNRVIATKCTHARTHARTHAHTHVWGRAAGVVHHVAAVAALSRVWLVDHSLVQSTCV